MAPDAGSAVRLVAVARGRVQAVGFRYFVVREARRHDVRGFVRNRPDGRSLELVAEGSRADLEALLARVRVGPPGAVVDAVATAWLPATAEFPDFGARVA